jgi:predicted nucleic acid-binding protein
VRDTPAPIHIWSSTRAKFNAFQIPTLKSLDVKPEHQRRNVWQYEWSRPKSIVQKQTARKYLRVCPIALGEVEWGMRTTNTTNPELRAKCRRFIEENMLEFVWYIETTARDSYAEITHEIWQSHSPPSANVDTQQHLSRLGIDVNDVWIAAIALERGLILLTKDQLYPIRNCVPEITIQNWLE